MQPNLKKIKNTDWYRQGGAIRLFYSFGPYHCINETIGYDKNIIYQKGVLNTAFFGKKEESENFWEIILKQAKNKNFIDQRITKWRRKAARLHRYCARCFHKSLENWSDKDLINFLNAYNRLALEMWKLGALIEWSDPEGQNLLQKFLHSYKTNFKPEKLELLTSPQKATFVQQEFLDRLRITEKLFKKQPIQKDLKNHSAKYSAIKNTWAYIHELDMRYFETQIKKVLKNLPTLKREAKAIKNKYQKIKKMQQTFQKSSSAPQTVKNVLYLFAKMAQWRDERKLLSVGIPNSYLYLILKRLAQINNSSLDRIGQLTYKEVASWHLDETALKIAEKREEDSIYYCSKDTKCFWLFGKPAKKLYKLLSALVIKTQTKEITGATAQKGKVKGKVKIIETDKDFKKMKKGDILVAQMTRPEYMPLIRLASAIVTDEGGLTCHAAIVSRELKIPCVIGTQVATTLLKDGDLVEVDANHGWVKKIR